MSSNAVIAGALAGLMEAVCTYPIDTIKTRMQLSGQPLASVIGTTTDLIRREGLLVLYRGLAMPILSEVPRRGIKFAANNTYSSWWTWNETTTQRIVGSALCGTMAGVTEVCFICPFELIKIRLQSPHHLQRYANAWQCARSVVRQEGWRRLYTGFEAYAWRSAIWNTSFFGVQGAMRNLWPYQPTTAADQQMPETTSYDTGRLFYDFACGAMGGTLGCLLNMPIDNVKVRRQNALRIGDMNLAKRYSAVAPRAVLVIFGEGGLRACYKGVTAQLLRAGPGAGIMVLAYNRIFPFLQSYTSTTSAR